ncbi:AAA family ATPase [Aeromonas hydrophila]|uniref:AAA family ATPase n=1 Tax=Aeromonas hydrophila TaxID=644 RepID=UPI003F7A4FD5
MKEKIYSICGKLPHTDKNISILVDNKNIIITGMNGCGKTVFLKTLLDAINIEVRPDMISQRKGVIANISTYERALSSPGISRAERESHKQQLEYHKLQLSNIDGKGLIKIEWGDHNAILDRAYQKKFLVSFFEATRQYSNINQGHNNHSSSLAEIIKNGQQQQLNQDFSINFESYLVAFFEAGYMASMMRNDPLEKLKVDDWLDSIVGDLRHLFEDNSLALQYNEKERCFYIKQDNKNPYTFSTLSSGYSSILKIYTDLLMKVELHNISPKELTGIVIIDEIDAHLHISLQKKILSFLNRSYPNVQFIVSTHSPFVLQSVDNAVIYDLSKLEQLEDLSLYSFDAITKGLLGVKTNSDELFKITDELLSLINMVEINRTRVNELIEKLSSVGGGLDSRARVILLMARQAIEDLEDL